MESLLKKAMQVTNAKNAKTLSPSHMKQCILSESRFDFLKDLVEKIPDVSTVEEVFDPVPHNNEAVQKVSNFLPEHNYASRMPIPKVSGNGTEHIKPLDLATTNSTEIAHCSSGPNFYKDLSNSPSYTPNSVIQYGSRQQNNKHTLPTNNISHTPPKLAKLDTSQTKALNSPCTVVTDAQPVFHLDLSQNSYNSPTTSTNQVATGSSPMFHIDLTKYNSHNPPPLVPITDKKQMHPLYSSKFSSANSNEELDEDYDN